jgi:L-fuconate dehydratase
VWKLVVDMPPEQLVSCLDFSYITDALTPDEALAILERLAPTRRQREQEMRRDGYPAYTTSTGWLGYADEKVRRLCRKAIAAGWTRFKMKVGQDLEGNLQRAALMREELGPEPRPNDGREPVLGRGGVDPPDQGARALRSLVDRGADEPGRRAGARSHRPAVAPIGVATGEPARTG